MKRTEAGIRALASDIGARPVGSEANEETCHYLEGVAQELGFAVTALSFECLRWEHGTSSLAMGGRTYEIHPGPFSPPANGKLPVVSVSTVHELRTATVAGKLLVIRGSLAATPFMPKDFPFYYPDDHKEIIDLIQEKNPAAVLALTGKHPMCGWDPFPLFDDGNLGVPNAFMSLNSKLTGTEGTVMIDSSVTPSAGRQLIFSNNLEDARRIVLCAHMDTQYDTPGALDNAAGVATLVGVMERLRDTLPITLEIVPFNGEEHYAAPGQLAYLARSQSRNEVPALVINVDGIGYSGSRSAFSHYNLSKKQSAEVADTVERCDATVPGEQWYAGDHAMFAFQGVPCIAVTSSDLEKALEITHTEEDTVECVEVEVIERTAEVIAEFVRSIYPRS